MEPQDRKTAMVTGANNGIGFETTIGMAEAGYHVVMACRSFDKAEAAKAEIIARLPGASLEVMVLDLSDFASVRSFADAYKQRHGHLDVLINNAGILLYSEKTNDIGIEVQFATNHLGHFLLTALLVELMPDDPASRIVMLSSIAHKGASISFDDLTCGGDGGAAYGQSKLACLLFGDELDRRLKAAGKQLRALSVHPGGSESGLFTDMSAEQFDALKEQVSELLQSNAAAAEPSLYAALSPDVPGGEYFGPTGPMEMSGKLGIAMRDPICKDTDVAKRLWRLSEELTGQPFPV